MKAINSILETKVSLFTDIKKVNQVQQITLKDSLTACTNPKGETAKLINKIRSTHDIPTQKKLKYDLPGIVFGAQMKTRANVPDRIINLTGLLCFDIDAADNPGMDMSQAKATLSQITNIIFCALSVRGNGLWGLIEVAHPERIKDHFEQLKIDFKKIGINLDPSKGGNPTDLRFLSFDPDAYQCDNYEVYSRLPKPKPKAKQSSNKRTSGTDPLQTAINKIHGASDGEKHHELLKAARLAGGYVASGKIGEKEAETALFAAISQKDIHSTTGALKTIRDGLKHGQGDPIEIPKYRKPQHITDPLIEYFKNLNPDGFIDEILIDDVPLAKAIEHYKNDRIALQLIYDELIKVPKIGEVERLQSVPSSVMAQI